LPTFVKNKNVWEIKNAKKRHQSKNNAKKRFYIYACSKSIDRYLLPVGLTAANLPQWGAAAGWHKQTDVRQLHRACSANYPTSANKPLAFSN